MNHDLEDDQHLTAEEMAAHLSAPGRLSDRARIEAHLLSCDACRHELVSAMRSMRKADQRPRAAGVGILAAAVLAAVLVWNPSDDLPRTRTDPILREAAPTSGEGVEQIGILTPEEGSIVARDALVFSWSVLGTRALYVLTVVDENGDIVWETRTLEPSARWPVDAPLVEGRLYWFVDALVDGDRSATTGVHGFVVR